MASEEAKAYIQRQIDRADARRKQTQDQKDFEHAANNTPRRVSGGSSTGTGDAWNNVETLLAAFGQEGLAAALSTQGRNGYMSGLDNRGRTNRIEAATQAKAGITPERGPDSIIGRKGNRAVSSRPVGGSRGGGMASPRDELMRGRGDMDIEAQRRRSREDAMFAAQLQERLEQNKFNRIRQMFGGLPKQRTSSQEQLVNIAGGFVPREVKSREDIDYTSLLARLL